MRQAMRRINWETIPTNPANMDKKLYLHRAKVPGGWLVFIHRGEAAGGAFYYPDPEHKWDGNTLP